MEILKNIEKYKSVERVACRAGPGQAGPCQLAIRRVITCPALSLTFGVNLIF